MKNVGVCVWEGGRGGGGAFYCRHITLTLAKAVIFNCMFVKTPFKYNFGPSLQKRFYYMQSLSPKVPFQLDTTFNVTTIPLMKVKMNFIIVSNSSLLFALTENITICSIKIGLT